MNHYGQLIKSIRTEKGITKEEMLQRTGLSEFDLAWLESRYVCYSPHAHFLISDALDYPFAELMKSGCCIDSYKDADHVRWVFGRLLYEEDIKSFLRISNVDDLNEDSINKMNTIVKESFEEHE